LQKPKKGFVVPPLVVRTYTLVALPLLVMGLQMMRLQALSFERTFELMHSWGFALREGVFAETKEGICRNKDLKS
jgi:hypothetical protein